MTMVTGLDLDLKLLKTLDKVGYVIYMSLQCCLEASTFFDYQTEIMIMCFGFVVFVKGTKE